MSIAVSIGGVDVTEKVTQQTFSISWRLGERATANLRLWDTTGTFTIAAGQELVVTDGGTPIFGGSVDSYTHERVTPAFWFFSVAAVGYESRLDKRVVNAVAYGRAPFTTNAISDLLIFLGTDCPFYDGYPVRVRTTNTPPGGLNTTTTYYVRDRTSTTCKLAATSGGSAINLTDDGTGDHHLIWMAGAVIRRLRDFYGILEGLTAGTIREGAAVELATYDYSKVSEIFQGMADISGYVWFVDASKAVHFVPRTEFTAPFSIGSGTTDVLAAGWSVRKTREEKANRILLRINDSAYADTGVSFVGDSSKRIFWVATPIRSMTSITLDAAEQTVGIVGETGLDWYYTPGDHWIYQDAGGTVLTSGNTLHVTYRAFGMQHQTAEDVSDQTAVAATETGTSGVYEMALADDSLANTTVGDTAAAALLARYKQLPVEVSYGARTAGVQVGQVQTIGLTEFGLSGSYLIDTVGAGFDDDGKLRYTVHAISTTRLANFLDVFKAFLTGGGGATSGGAAGGGGAIVSGGVTIQEVTLADGPGTTTISATIDASAGAVLAMDIAQSAVGGRQIAWSSQFSSGTSVNILMGPNEHTKKIFIGLSDSKWYLFSILQ